MIKINNIENIREKKQLNPKEDLLMLLALDSQAHAKLKQSSLYFEELYKINKNEHYLIKSIGFSFKSQNYKKMNRLSLQGITEFPKNKSG